MSTKHSIVTEMANIAPKMAGKLKGYEDMEKIVDEDSKEQQKWKFTSFMNENMEKLSALKRGTVILVMIILCLGILSFALIIAFLIVASRPSVTVKQVKPFGCASSHCLKRSGEMEDSLDRSANPCDDFYAYSCGGWRQRTAVPAGEAEITIKLAIDTQIRDRLTEYLEAPVLRNYSNSAEMKLKLLFKSCINDYEKTRQGSNPLLKIIEQAVGDWYVFSEKKDSWSYQKSFERIQTDYRTEALIKVEVNQDDDHPGIKAITIYTSGLGMWNYWYVATYPRAVKVREDYKSFMRTVAKLLVRDSGFDINDDVRDERIETFVDDVITFETDLANISRSSSFDRNRYDDEERVSLTTLNTQTSNAIDWLSFFGYMFNTAGITANTKVVITQKQYILGMSNYLNNMGENKTRILNNYFVWRLAVNYVQDLSWEYVHANRQFYVDRTGRAQFLGTWRYCFKYVSRKMDIALSHLYIKDHFADDNKKKVEEIAGYIRQSLITHMSDFKWMDDKTIQYAKSKVKAIVDKLGYPDFIMDPDKVDDIYASLQINATDYFQNVLNLNIFDKVDWNNQLKNGVDRTQWRGNTYGTFAQFYYPWNELLVPAGILQWPIYDYHIPHYLNFGAMGSVIAHMYVHSIDFTGSYYQTNGTIMRSDEGKYIRWWTNSTTYKFNDAKKCFVDYYTNKTLGPFNINGRKMTVPVRAPNYAAEGALEVGGLKQAYYGYKKWESDSKGEPMAPGLGLNNDQMFFVAYAQTWCYVRNDITAYNYAMRGRLPEDMKVNTAVAQMKEFSKAFNCPANAPMNPAKKCSIW